MMTSSTPRWSHTGLQLCYLDDYGRGNMTGRMPGAREGQRHCDHELLNGLCRGVMQDTCRHDRYRGISPYNRLLECR